MTRLSLRGTASANPGPLLTPRAEPKPPRSLPKPNIDPAAKSASHYDLRSRTAPVNKIRRDFDVYGSASRGSTSKVGSTTKVAAKVRE